MSKIFYDVHIHFEEIEIELDKLEIEHEEKQELEHLIEEMVHHRIMDRLLMHLPRQHHTEFLDRFHKTPYDHKLLSWLDARIEKSVEEHIKDEMEKLKEKILSDIQASRKATKK